MAEDTVNEEHLLETGSDEVPELKQRIAHLEEVLVVRDAELASVNKSVTDLQEQLADTGRILVEAVTDYRTLVLQTNPDIEEELITGESVPAIKESLAKARSLMSKVRQSMEKDVTGARIPIGSPGRQTPDLSALSPREKIHYAIGGKK